MTIVQSALPTGYGATRFLSAATARSGHQGAIGSDPLELLMPTPPARERVKNGRLYLPASEETCGHGTTGNAKYYSIELRELLQTAPYRAM